MAWDYPGVEVQVNAFIHSFIYGNSYRVYFFLSCQLYTDMIMHIVSVLWLAVFAAVVLSLPLHGKILYLKTKHFI